MHVHEEVQERLEKISTNKGFAQQSTSLQYHQLPDEWEKDLDDDEVEQMVSKYVKIILQIKHLEKQVFATEVVYQSRMEVKAEHNTPSITINNAITKGTTSANVLSHSESKVKQSRQNILLPRAWVWSRYVQDAHQKPIPTPNYCSFCKQEGHASTKCPFVEKDIQDAMIHHFQTKV